jgi:hypothetical protein
VFENLFRGGRTQAYNLYIYQLYIHEFSQQKKKCIRNTIVVIRLLSNQNNYSTAMFQVGWSNLVDLGPTRRLIVINRRPGRLIDPS